MILKRLSLGGRAHSDSTAPKIGSLFRFEDLDFGYNDPLSDILLP